MGIFNSFNARTTRINLLSNIKENKIFLIVIAFIVIVQIYLIYYGGSMFRTYGLSLKELIITILFASTVIPIDWLRKIYIHHKNKNINI